MPLKIPNPLGLPFPKDQAAFSTASVWRGADAIIANSVGGGAGGQGWFYQGDEGNQDAGEVNGQMRGYDLVVSSESGPAKGVITSSATRHL